MDNSKKIILDLCGGTGAWSKPYKDAGYDVRVITLPDYNIVNWRQYVDILRPVEDNEIYGILAAPPCTEFSIARNDKTAKRKRDLRKGMLTIKACQEIIVECLYSPYRKSENSLKFWALENPYSGYLKRFLGEPPLVFDPCDYGDPYTKKTAIWGMFNIPKKKPVKADRGTMVKYASKFKDLKPVDEKYRKKLGIDARTIRRSITPTGFANSFYKSNK